MAKRFVILFCLASQQKPFVYSHIRNEGNKKGNGYKIKNFLTCWIKSSFSIWEDKCCDQKKANNKKLLTSCKGRLHLFSSFSQNLCVNFQHVLSGDALYWSISPAFYEFPKSFLEIFLLVFCECHMVSKAISWCFIRIHELLPRIFLAAL